MIKKLFSSQLRINMASGVATTVINTVMMAVMYPIYLHFLGYEKYGVWLILTTVIIFAQLGNLGMSPAVMKLVAEDHGRGDIKGIQCYVTMALALLCISGTIVLIAILSLKNQIITAFKLNGENAKIALWLLPYIGVLSIYVYVVQVFEALLAGLGRMDLTNYIQSFSKGINISVSGVLLAIGFGVKSLLIGSILSYLFIHIANMVCIWRISPVRFLQIGGFDVYRCRRLLHFGGIVLISSLTNMLLSPFNKLVLSRYVGVSSIPIYEIASMGSSQVKNLTEAGLRALMPEASYANENKTGNATERIPQLYRRVMKLIFLFGIPMYGGIIILLSPLLKFWLGAKFVDTLPGVFGIMLFSAFVSLLGLPSYYTLLGLGRVLFTLTSHIILSGLSTLLVLAIIFVRHNISVEQICWVMVIAATVTTLYLTNKAHKTFLKK